MNHACNSRSCVENDRGPETEDGQSALFRSSVSGLPSKFGMLRPVAFAGSALIGLINSKLRL